MRHRGLRRLVGAGCELHVLGNVDQHRPGAPLRCDVERLMQHPGERVCLLHQPVVLGAGAGDANGVGLLEGVGADHEGRNLTGEHDDRDRIHQGIGQAGHGVRRTGSGRHEDHAGLAGGARVSFGRMHRPLFVTHQNVANGVLLEHLVVNR